MVAVDADGLSLLAARRQEETQPSFDSYAGVDAAAPYTPPEAPILDGLGHIWNSATQAWDWQDGTPYDPFYSSPAPAPASFGGFPGFAGQQVYEAPAWEIPPPTVAPPQQWDIAPGAGQFYDTWMPQGGGYRALEPVDRFTPQGEEMWPISGEQFDAGQQAFTDALSSPARRLYEQGLDWEDPQLLGLARQPGQANPWDLFKPFDYLAEVGADITPAAADVLGLGNAYRLGDKLIEQSPIGFLNPPDMPTRAQAFRETAGDIRDPGAALEEFYDRPLYQQFAAQAIYDPLNPFGFSKADEVVDAARAVGRYGDDALTGLRGLVDNRPRLPALPEAIARGEEGAFNPEPLIDAAQRAGTRLFGDAAAREGRPVAGGIFDTIAPTEKAGRGLLRQYEGATGTAGLELRKVMDEGNTLLRDAGVPGTFDGTRFNVKAGQPEVDALYAALHGEGPVPPKLQGVYDYIKTQVALEEQASVDAAQAFGRDFIPRDDYFYRGWKAPKATHAGGPNFGATPGYQKPRTDATYLELRAAGYEPASWNPIEMLALRRQAGVQWREQQELLAGLKETGQAMPLSQAKELALDDWRVPQVGPAFEGKPRAYIPDVGTGNLAEVSSRAAITYTDPIAVPNSVANTLEGIFGKRPDFGVGNVVLDAGQALKRNKLLASLFQQVDFTGRTLGALTAGAVDELAETAISMAKLKPVEAVEHAYQAGRKLVKVPPTVAKLIASNVSGNYQKALRDEILSGKPIIKSRPGVTLRGISEAGGKFGEDITLVTRDIRKELREAVAEGPPSWLGKAHDATTGRVTRRVGRLNAAAQRGLFDGIYVVAQKTGAENFIVPRLVRQHPKWTDQQIMAAAADELNKMYSTLGRYQTVLQNPILNELARGFIFSTNETEALLRGAASTVIGPNKRLWTEFYLGTFLSLAGAAALIHKASTGEWLPAERLNPISKDDFGPLPISYNSRFLAPDIPLKGRNGTRLSLDLVGQMDTAFRLLDPLSFIQARENVLPRAATTQLSGKSFFGEDVGGIKGRLAHAASDLFEPIGVQQGRGVAGVGPGLAEGRIGQAGYAIQAAGLNVRGESSAMLRDRKAQERYGRDWDKLEPFERKAILDSDPSFNNELETRQDEAAKQEQEWAAQAERMDAKKQEFADRQAAIDQELETGDLQPARWRKQRGDLILEKRGAMDVLTAEFEPRKPEEQTALDRYFAQIDASKNGEEVDWGKVEAWLLAQPAAEQGFIERNLGLNRTPTEQQYKADVKQIADSGYWDIGDMAAQIWGKKLGIDAQSQSELEDAMREGYALALKDIGLNAQQARIKANQLVEKDLGDMYQRIQKVRKDMRKDPELMRLLVKWDYYEPGKESMGDALRAVAGDD